MKQIITLKNKSLQLISRLSFFDQFNAAEKILLIDASGMMLLAEENEYILKEGSTDTSLYIPLTGKLAVRMKNSQGSDVTIAELHPGDIVGEATFLTDKPRSADVVALSQTVLFRCSRSAFNTLPASAREKIKDQIILKLIDRLHQKNIESIRQ